jgi:exopolysaccharide biosynthesis polyprenyl glycosylphosphotransferase
MLAFVISAHLAGAEGQQQPYFAVGLFLLSTLLLTALWHTSYLALFNKQTRRRRILAVGTHDSARTLARAALHISSLYHVVGIVCNDQEQVEQEKAVASIPVLGNSTHLWYLVVSQEITDIIVESLPHDSEVLTRTLQICREHGVNVTGLAGFYEEIAGRVAIGQPKPDAPYDCQSRTTSLQAMIGERCRRFIDIMLALAGLALLLPTLPFIALAIYIDNPGPIFYRQERVGKGGKIFSLLKFRSMVTNAEQNGQAVWANSNDPRVTHVGMLLRSARIDELPQVLNVLKGDMSIVGPRPERPQFVEQLQEHISCYGVRHQVKPGLTGWAQVNYRYGSSVDDAFTKLEYDLYYLKHQSLLLDMLIVLRTFKVVLLMRGT